MIFILIYRNRQGVINSEQERVSVSYVRVTFAKPATNDCIDCFRKTTNDDDALHTWPT